jgi:hypothetical protein
MNYRITAYSSIKPHLATVNGSVLYEDENFINFAPFIKALYKQEKIGYPKFYKMDSLSKLGFITAELALQKHPVALYHPEDVGIVLSNRSASLDTDIKYQETINDRNNYYPSPSVFVYTLPNIMIGEIAIKNKIKGENAFLVSETFDSQMLYAYVHDLLQHKRISACLTGWVELLEDQFKSLVMIVESSDTPGESDPGFEPIPFTVESMNRLYQSI